MTKRPSDPLFALFAVRLLVFVIAAVAFLPGVLDDPPHLIAYFHDEHNILTFEEYARLSYVKFHQLPMWNPYYCGGVPGIASPPDTSLSPDFLLRVIFGTLPGRRLTALLFVLLGMEGTYRLARRHDASVIGAAVAGIAFASSYHFVTLIGLGWIFMYAYQLIPWATLSFEEGLRDTKWAVIGGLFMAWMVFCGGTYVASYAALVLAVVVTIETARALLRADGRESVTWYRPALVLGIMACVALGVTAIRTLPMLQVITSFPRTVVQKDQDNPFTILAWVAFSHSDRGVMHGAAGEFFVGTIVTILAGISLLFRDRAGARFLGIALLFGVLACGEITEHAPYVYLHKLPIYAQLRFPFRMTVLVALFIALGAARGLTRIEDAWIEAARKAKGRRLDLPLWLLLSVAGALVATFIGFRAAREVVFENSIGRGTVYNFETPLRYLQDFKQSRGNRWDAQVWTFANLGTLQCFEENAYPQSPLLRGDLPAEEYPAPGSDATVKRLKWSPNVIVLAVSAKAPSRILINQNYDASFRTNVGKVVSHEKLLAVDVPAGEHRVVIRYINTRMVIGGIITVGTLLLLLWYFGRIVRDRARLEIERYRALPSRPQASAGEAGKPAPPLPHEEGEARSEGDPGDP